MDQKSIVYWHLAGAVALRAISCRTGVGNQKLGDVDDEEDGWRREVGMISVYEPLTAPQSESREAVVGRRDAQTLAYSICVNLHVK